MRRRSAGSPERATQRNGPLPSEQRSDVLGHETGDRERVGHTGVTRFGADVVAVVERNGPGGLEGEHRSHVRRDARARAPHIVIRRSASQCGGGGERQAGGDIAVQRIVRRRLVRHDVGLEAAPHQLGQHVGAVSNEPDRDSGSVSPSVLAPRQRLIDRSCRAVEIAGLETTLHARGIDFHGEANALVHRGGQRLRAAHPA